MNRTILMAIALVGGVPLVRSTELLWAFRQPRPGPNGGVVAV